MLLASLMIGLITFLLVFSIGLVDDTVGFVAGGINFVFALPFTLVTALIYRKMQRSARFEFLTALFVGGAGVIVGDLILLNFILSRVVLD